MKIENVEIMVIKIGEIKTNNKNEPYAVIDFAVLEDGTTFSLMLKDLDQLKNLVPFKTTTINLELTNNPKYGLSLKFC